MLKFRRGPDGAHFFDRDSGLNILLDEVEFAPEDWSCAPRFVSFAITNQCDLKCHFCYAPKQRLQLNHDDVLRWCSELDANGCLGVGFGGGEPTLFGGLARLCRDACTSTQLSISITTHANRFTAKLRDELTGYVHFLRVSMDGVNATYERIRGRPFGDFLQHVKLVADTSPFGINYVVNDETIADLDEALDLSLAAGARDFLLLPEVSQQKLSPTVHAELARWISRNYERARLSISEHAAPEAIPVADPFAIEKGVRAYVHVNAEGCVSATSYDQTNAMPIGTRGLLGAIAAYAGGHS
jgi:MoaA/NifB/PqqE/SkfB family radical SAM enzyme